MKKIVAEFVGTLVLVLFGCGSAVLAGDQVGQLGISFAFGLAIVAMAYGIGPISGCHINPAVTVGAFLAGRVGMADLVRYIPAQIIGATVGAAILLAIASGTAGYTLADNGLGQNGWGVDYLGEYSLIAAFLFEVVMTALFLIVILGVTEKGADNAFAGLAIGLTLVAIHIVGIQVTGVSVNPARSFGPAVVVGGQALAQLWLFIVAPIIGASLAGILYRTGILGTDASPVGEQ